MIRVGARPILQTERYAMKCINSWHPDFTSLPEGVKLMLLTSEQMFSKAGEGLEDKDHWSLAKDDDLAFCELFFRTRRPALARAGCSWWS